MLKPIKERVNPQFLCAVLNTPVARLQFARALKGIGVPDLHLENIRDTLIPFPAEDIQNALVTELELAREARQKKFAQADELLSGLDNYLLNQLGLIPPSDDKRLSFAVKPSHLNSNRIDSFFYTPYLISTEQAVHELNMKVVPLLSLLESPPTNGVDARDYNEVGQRYLRVQNIRPFEILFDDVKRVSITSSKDVALKTRDILLTRKGTFGVAAIVTKEAEDCLISSEIMLLRMLLNGKCSADYLVAWLNSSVARSLLNRHKTGGIMGHVTQDVVSNFPVPIPERRIQNLIAAEVKRKREAVQQLRNEATTEWAAAKARFERKLLG